MLEDVPERYTSFLMSKDWYHTAEIPLFARELREDLAHRFASAPDIDEAGGLEGAAHQEGQ